MSEHHDPTKRIRIVPEPAAPINEHDELQLDDALLSIETQLKSEAEMLMALANGAETPAETAPGWADAKSLAAVAEQLTHEARQLASHLDHEALPASPTHGGPAPSSPAQAPRSPWRAATWRGAPMAAVAILLCAFLLTDWAPPPDNARQRPGEPSQADVAALNHSNNPTPSSTAPTLDDSHSPKHAESSPAPSADPNVIPWRDLSSPALEGALDLVDDQSVAISI